MPHAPHAPPPVLRTVPGPLPDHAPRPATGGAGERYAPPSGLKRSFLTALTAAGLTGLWAGYAALVTPLLTGGAAVAAARDRLPVAGELAAPPENRTLAERWLGHAPWAATADMQADAGGVVTFWNTLETVRDGHGLRVAPFAMVIEADAPPGTQAARPTTLVADSAVLRFERAVSTDAARTPGRVIAAVFTGAVRVDGADGLRIVGSNFFYKEKSAKLWSDKPVAFAHGGHTGEGTGVDVALFRTGPATDYDSFAADGVKEVEVAGPVSVAMITDRFPGLDAAAGDGAADGVAADRNEPAAADAPPVRVTGSGPFAFDPHANTARFATAAGAVGGVRAWWDDPANASAGVGPDELTCDVLTVRLEPATPGAKTEAEAMRAARADREWGDRDFYAADDDLAPVAVVAEGSPGSPVRVLSPSRGLTATAGKLTHDLPADVLTLTAPPAVNGGRVEVRGPDARVRCPRLTVLPPADAETGEPRRVRCDGPGELLRADPATGKLAAKVTWPGTLVTRRDAATGRDVVRLTGRPDAPRDADGHTTLADQVIVDNLADATGLAGDAVELHLEPTPGPAGGEPADPAGPLADANPLGGSVRPAFAKAVGSVRIRGPQLWAGAESMEVTFEDPVGPVAVFGPERNAGAEPGNDRSAKPRTGSAEGRKRPAGDPRTAEVAAVPQAAEPEPPPKSGPPSKFYADHVTATVVRPRTVRGKEVEAAYVRLAEAVGGVELFREVDGGAVQSALAARAEVRGEGPDDQTLSLLGAPGTPQTPASPATLSGDGAVLTGPRIDFDPAANTAVVVGGGAIDLPVKGGGMPGFARDPAAAPEPAPAPGEPPRDRTVRVQWGEKMTFDGAVAVFEGRARTTFHAEQADGLVEEWVGLHCERMTVTLTEPVTFGDKLPGAGRRDAGKKSAKSDAAPAIEFITCSGQVFVNGRQDAPDPRDPAAGPKEAQRVRGEFAQLRVHWETGDFTAEGKGKLKVWRRDDTLAERPTAAVTVRPNAPSRRREVLPCELIDVRFTREVAGNLRGPDATFHPDADGQITVLHGPVRDFAVGLDADDLTPGATRLECRTLELKHLPDPAGGAAKVRTLLAGGGVVLSGRTDFGWFDADGPTATFNEAKGRLEISGPRPDSVRFFRRATRHGVPDSFVTRATTYFPATNRFDSAELTGADGLP